MFQVIEFHEFHEILWNARISGALAGWKVCQHVAACGIKIRPEINTCSIPAGCRFFDSSMLAAGSLAGWLTGWWAEKRAEVDVCWWDGLNG